MDPFTEKNIDEINTWADKMVASGNMKDITIRLQKTALKSLMQPLLPEEPRTAGWLLDNLVNLGNRLSNANPKGAGTVQTYVSRARTLLTTYRRFLSNPSGFRAHTNVRKTSDPGADRPRSQRSGAPPSPTVPPRTAPPSTADTPPPTAADRSPAAATPTAATPTAAAPQTDTNPPENTGEYRRFPLPEGRDFVFALPMVFTKSDAHRVAFHLMTLSQDFEPDPNMFSSQPRG